MKPLYAKSAEFLNIPTSDNTAGTLTVSFDDGDTWSDLEAVDATNARVHVAGPNAEAGDLSPTTVTLPVGIYRVFVRFRTPDECVIRRLDGHLRVIEFPT